MCKYSMSLSFSGQIQYRNTAIVVPSVDYYNLQAPKASFG